MHIKSIPKAAIVRAARPHGLLTRAQLLELGLGTDAITYRCAHGSLFRVHFGVYSVGRPPATAIERAAAAVLACGSGAALSHSSALTLWGLDKRWREPFHVTCPSLRRRTGILTHRASGLRRADVRTHLGIRVTSPARTVLDVARELPERRLVRLVADARRAGLLHLGQLAEVTERFPHHPGASRLRALLADPGEPTRSEFEDAFLAFCQRHGLPRPLVNTKVNGIEVDALFAEHGVIVELDGWAFHRDRHVFESDRERDAVLAAAGYVVVRITWRRLVGDPGGEADRLRQTLSRGSAPWGRCGPVRRT